MATIADQLTKLDELRRQLAANLTAMGVTASETETLTQLVPKVLDISTGGGPDEIKAMTVNLNVNSAFVTDSGEPADVYVSIVDIENIAAENPDAAMAYDDKKAILSEIVAVSPEEKETALTEYFDKQGYEVMDAIQSAIAESSEAGSIADIEPMLVTPIYVESPALEEGKVVTIKFNIPNEFTEYNLTVNSFVCAELIDINGNTHIVTFKILDDGAFYLQGDFPVAGYLSVFWFGSSVTAI